MVHFHKLHHHRSIRRARSHPYRNGGHDGHGGGVHDDHRSGRDHQEYDHSGCGRLEFYHSGRGGHRNDHHRQLGLDQHRQCVKNGHDVHDHHIKHMDRGERSRTHRGHRQLIHTSQLCNQLGQSLLVVCE